MSENPLEIGNKEVDEAFTLALPKEMAPQESTESEEPLSNRSKNASRAFRATIVGLVFFPSALILFPYSTWLLYQVVYSKENLERRSRRHAILAGVINCSVVLFVFLILISLFLPQRDPRFHYPVEMFGTWATEDHALVMELRKNGKLIYRAKGPPEIEFSGIWGLGNSGFFVEVRNITKGDDQFPFPKGQLFAWDLHHYSYWEIVFGGKEKTRLVRKK